MKVKIEIKSWVSGAVLFEFEKENNTVKDTLVEANLRGANLYGANLRGANLYEANLRGANLHGADLYEADLRGANLYGANLYGANLYEANLYEANLYEANLRGANLYEANLRGANLHGADLRGANLYGANLYGANLYEANLREADLRGADLRGANLHGADLRGANLRGAYNAEEIFAQTLIVPDGDIIGWKKCSNGVLAKLLIPKDAKRSNATGRKCRAEYVEVLELINLSDKRKKANVGISDYNNSVEYRVGETVKCDKWDEDRFNECSGGIHFFITKTEAENYSL